MNIRMFKCPVCHRLHPVTDDTDLNEVTCTDNATSEIREIRAIPNEDRYSRGDWNFIRFDTKKKEYSNEAKLVGLNYNKPHPKNVKNW